MIKVADFGLTEDMYATNYFRHDKSEDMSEEKVPIRWMAPESIEIGIYTQRTDVVSILICLSRWFINGLHAECFIMYVINCSGHLV